MEYINFIEMKMKRDDNMKRGKRGVECKGGRYR
jgi:hypothetical protein